MPAQDTIRKQRELLASVRKAAEGIRAANPILAQSFTTDEVVRVILDDVAEEQSTLDGAIRKALLTGYRAPNITKQLLPSVQKAKGKQPLPSDLTAEIRKQAEQS